MGPSMEIVWSMKMAVKLSLEAEVFVKMEGYESSLFTLVLLSGGELQKDAKMFESLSYISCLGDWKTPITMIFFFSSPSSLHSKMRAVFCFPDFWMVL